MLIKATPRPDFDDLRSALATPHRCLLTSHRNDGEDLGLSKEAEGQDMILITVVMGKTEDCDFPAIDTPEGRWKVSTELDGLRRLQQSALQNAYKSLGTNASLMAVIQALIITSRFDTS
jgi:hypothetical protein